MVNEVAESAQSVANFQKWAAIFVSISVLGYLGYAVLFVGLKSTGTVLISFPWTVYVGVLALTLVNYSLRGVKWAYLLGRVGVRLPFVMHTLVFTTGLSMVISPGKIGELLKPVMVSRMTGIPKTQTVPVLVAERITDGIAVLILSSVGVGFYYADGVSSVVALSVLICCCFGFLAYEPISDFSLRLCERIPFVSRAVPKVRESLGALRHCLSPVPLAYTMLLSLVAWFAECIGAWMVFKALAVEMSLDAATFLYAFATLFGAPSPGGIGASDAALVEGTILMAPSTTLEVALAATLLIRVATLWFGVLMGGILLFRVDQMVEAGKRWTTAQGLWKGEVKP